MGTIIGFPSPSVRPGGPQDSQPHRKEEAAGPHISSQGGRHAPDAWLLITRLRVREAGRPRGREAGLPNPTRPPCSLPTAAAAGEPCSVPGPGLGAGAGLRWGAGTQLGLLLCVCPGTGGCYKLCPQGRWPRGPGCPSVQLGPGHGGGHPPALGLHVAMASAEWPRLVEASPPSLAPQGEGGF